MPSKVSFTDIAHQYESLKDRFHRALDRIGADSSYILGESVTKFENEFASYSGGRFCCGVATGTDALRLAFWSLGLNPGDEVIMPALTFVATAVGIIECGLVPRLVDVDPDTFLFDYDLLEEAITEKTKAICPVHLYGRACDMDKIASFAKRHSLFVIEDAAQAHGAEWNGRRVGSFGDCGCFSFYPAKNLGALGDGGAVVTSSDVLNQKIRQLRNYGSAKKYEHPVFGINSRLDSLQAAFLSIKLEHLDEWNRARVRIARCYNEHLSDLQRYGLNLPDLAHPGGHVFHLYVVQVDNRSSVIEHLSRVGIETGIHYPVPFYLQSGYSNLGYRRGQFSVSDGLSARILSLPISPSMTEEDVDIVAKSLRDALERSSNA